MMEYGHEDFNWSDEKTIEQCLTKDFTFPKLLLLTSGFASSSPERTFDNYQMLWIEGAFVQTRINGVDAKNSAISIPKCCIHTFSTPKQKEPQFLFQILRKEKLPCLVFPSEDWSDVYLQSDIAKLSDRLSKILLTKETEGPYFYGISLLGMHQDVSNMITLPSYMNLTFKVALSFKDLDRNLHQFLASIKLKHKHFKRPDIKILQDIVFQLKEGRNSTIIIVSLKNPKKEKKIRRPRLPVPISEHQVIDALALPARKCLNTVETVKSTSSQEQYQAIYEVPSQNMQKELSLRKEFNRYVDLPRNTPIESWSIKEEETCSSMTQVQRLKPPRIQSKFIVPIPCSEQVPNKSTPYVKIIAETLETNSLVGMPSGWNESGHTTKIPPIPYTRSKGNTDLDNPDTKAACYEEDIFDVRKFSIDEVSSHLEILNLQKYILIFQFHKVDGMILSELDEEIMTKEFNMKRIETLRLLRFIKTGHIPK